MIKRLRPIIVKESHVREVSGEIIRAMYETIFLPLFDILGTKVPRRVNSMADIKAAIRSGRIFWEDGYFYGDFNAVIGRSLRAIGAKFSSRKKAYKLAMADIPMDLRTDIAIGKGMNKAKIDAILKALKDAGEMKVIVGAGDAAVSIMADLNKQAIETMKILPENLQIPMQLSTQQQKEIEESYSDVMEQRTRDLYADQINRLLEKTQENAALGYRADRLAKIIKSEFGTTKNKIGFLARQSTSVFVSQYRQARYEGSGITKYQWSTSNDERVRPDHAKLHGRIFPWSDPPVTDTATQARNHPGEDFNCVPEDSFINLAYSIEKCFRRWYTGELTEVVTDTGKTIRATPNHEVLTVSGWKAIGLLDNGDYIVDLGDELVKPFKDDINNGKFMIGNIFKSLQHNFFMRSAHASGEQFHGDGVDCDVDIIDTTRPLGIDRKPGFLERVRKFEFTHPNAFTSCLGDFVHYFGCSFFNIFPPLTISKACNSLSFFFAGSLKSDNVCFRSSSDMDTGFNKSLVDNNSIDSGSFRDRKLALSSEVRLDNGRDVDIETIISRSTGPSIGIYADASQTLRKIIGVKAEDFSGFIKGFPGVKKTSRVVKVINRNFSGHVYNLQTFNNWFCINGLVTHNCRCVAIPIVNLKEL